MARFLTVVAVATVMALGTPWPAPAQIPPMACEQQLPVLSHLADQLADSRRECEVGLARTRAGNADLRRQVQELEGKLKAATEKKAEPKPKEPEQK